MSKTHVAKFLDGGYLRPGRGFTLIELMITIAIAGILLAIGVPSMRDMIHQNRLTGHVNEFVAANLLARSEAIKRGSQVKICRSANAETSDTCSTGAGDWSSGWLVAIPNPDDATKNDEILSRHGALPAGTSASSSLDAITYNGMGQPVLAADSDSTGFTFDNDCKLSRRQVDIGRTGRTAVATIAAAGC